jgi:AcrR family transcriptional regulator
MANEQNGLRERKKTALQRLLTDTTIDLFLEHGFHGTTVDRIAEVAGISRRTFFHYFPAKQAQTQHSCHKPQGEWGI